MQLDNKAQDTQTQVMQQILLANLKEQRSARRWRIFFRLLWLSIIVLVIMYSINDKHNGIKSGNQKSVGLVELKGVIGNEEDTYKLMKTSLENALKDKNIVGVIIKANSPGGSPVYSDMVYNLIKELTVKYQNKPIDVVIEEVCASGCYYIASAMQNIYASPASIVGSIGVIYTGIGINNLMQKLGIDSRLLIAGKNKAMGYPLVANNKEQTKLQQDMLNKVHIQFINAVKNGRMNRLHIDDETFSGRYWIGEDALKIGLIDGFASVDSLAKTKYHTDNIIDFTENKDPFDKISKKFGLEIHSILNEIVASGSFLKIQ